MSQSYIDKIEIYIAKTHRQCVDSLGGGTQGSVFLIEEPGNPSYTAVKIHRREIAYQRELEVYLRLRDLEISQVCGHDVPILLAHDEDLMALEMTTVSPPFCLDFGGAYLDRPPDYSDEVWDDWLIQKSEAFEDHWPAVEEILSDFRLMGIFIADVNPGNIRF